MKPIRLMAGAMTVGFWTLLSRVMGLCRDVMLQAFIGPGPVMDAFIVAFRLPNMFRRLFAEGAFNSAFVPMFSKRMESGDDPDGFASDALSGLAFCLVIFSAIAITFMPAMVWLTAGDLDGGRPDLAVQYGRIVLPYIIMISLAALFSGVLNASGRFGAAAAAPVFLNILLVGVMLFAWAVGGEAITYVVWTIPVAGVVQMLVVWIAADRAGLRIRPRYPRLSPDMRRLIKVALPSALAAGVLQINLVVGQWVAEDYPGAISWLFGADRLYQLPLGVVGIAIGIVLLPDLSRRLEAGDAAGSRAAFSRATEFSMLLTLPAAMALLVIPLPLVSVLYERGATGPRRQRGDGAGPGNLRAGSARIRVAEIVATPVFRPRRYDPTVPFCHHRHAGQCRLCLWPATVVGMVVSGAGRHIIRMDHGRLPAIGRAQIR